MRDWFNNLFSEINLLHVLFITTISVFFKEFLYFLFENFEDFKLKDSIGKFNSKGSIAKDIPSILNHAGNDENQGNSSSKRPSAFKDEDNRSKKSRWDSSDEDSDSGAQASGSGAQASGSGAQASGSGTQASGSGTQPSYGNIADDLRNYTYDSDSNSDFGYHNLKSWSEKSESLKSEGNQSTGVRGHNLGIIDSIPRFQERVAEMNDSNSITELRATIKSVRDGYDSNRGIPAAEAQIPLLEQKLDICDSRLSELESEKANPSKDKGKGKAVEYRISELESEKGNPSKDKGKGKANE